MLNNGEKNRTSHGSEHEEGGEAHVVLQEVCEVVVVEKHKEEGDEGDENYEDESVQESAFELLGGRVGGALEVDQVCRSPDRSRRRRG